MNTTDIKTLLIDALALGGIDTTKPAAYEVWLRHIEDEEEFLWAQGWDSPTADQMLYWAYCQAVDVEGGDYGSGDKADRAIARKYIIGLWKRQDKEMNKVLGFTSNDWSLEFKFIDNLIAKTLPDGHEESWQVWNTTHTRHIKGGKWHKGPYKK